MEILLELWDRIDKDLDQQFPTTEEKWKFLRAVALHMQLSGAREIDRSELEEIVVANVPSAKTEEEAREVVRQLEVRSGVMVERSIDKLAFSHLTFLEYLVVEYLSERRRSGDSLDDYVKDPRWCEPLLLMCGTDTVPMPALELVFQVTAVRLKVK